MAPKSKPQKMGLGDFLADQSLGSWADEMEDAPIQCGTGYGAERRNFSSGPGAFGRNDSSSTFDRGGMSYAVREQLPLPSKPPYTSHLGNLPFDATNGDIEDFFAGCDVTSIRIVEDKLDRKPKGFGYVEFGTLEGLKKALELNGEQFQGRGIRISVADPPKDRVEAREITDWSRKGPLPDLPNQSARRASDRGGGFGDRPERGGFERRGYEPSGGAEMERGGSRRGAPAFEGDGKPRDFGNWERKGPLSPAPSAIPLGEGGRVRSRDGPRERKNSPAWGEGQGRQDSQDGSRPPRREFQERPPVERQPTAADLDNAWRARMKPDAPAKSATPTPEPSAPSSPAQPPAPASRPKLNLAKRTVSQAADIPATGPQAPDSKASPFGGARPVDTAAKEKEVEEKRQIAIREKKEADDKAREERKAKEAEEKKEEEADGSDKNGDGPKNTYTILSRADTQEQTGEKAASTNGDTIEEKTAKPKEFVREPPTGPKNEGRGGTWRGSRGRGDGYRGRGDRGGRGGSRQSSTPATPISPKVDSPAETVDEDGWSKVPPKSKPARGGRGGARGVMAS